MDLVRSAVVVLVSYKRDIKEINTYHRQKKIQWGKKRDTNLLQGGGGTVLKGRKMLPERP